MGFVDALVPRSPDDVDVIIVDKRDRTGGHWNDVYPFVRLHQPAAIFGADSLQLLDDRIDEHGPNAGFYQLATAPQVLAYYDRLLESFAERGGIHFLGATEYIGMDGDDHVLRSVVTGKTTTVKVRRRLVDTMYAAPTIPSRHTPSFGIDASARVIPPNDLIELADRPSHYTILGAGKTAMDAVSWLLDHGVDAASIRWVRPRDVYVLRRMATQPLTLIGQGFMKLQAGWMKAAAQAADTRELGRILEQEGVFARLDPHVEPTLFRGATVSDAEIESLRTVTDVVRLGHVVHLAADRMKLEQGEVATPADHAYVDCTAMGVVEVPIRPVFEPGRITFQIITLGNVPFSAATIGVVEAVVEDDETKNLMCAPLGSFGSPEQTAFAALTFLQSTPHRMFHPQVGAWLEETRLNNARVIPEMRDDPDVQAAQAAVFEYLGPAIENLTRMLASS